MMTVLVLALPDFSVLFVVESDVLGFGVGAVLMEGHRPIAYFSQALAEHQKMKYV